jgi:hypothetical protein
LRTRIVVIDGVPTQEIGEPSDHELEVLELTALVEEQREIEVKDLMDRLIFQPIDVRSDPLFKTWLLRLDDEDYVLIAAMEHIISDGVSKGIFLRDLLDAYVQVCSGRGFSFPGIPIQFPEYALSQRSAEKAWAEKHKAWWTEHFSGCQRLRFPADERLAAAGNTGRQGLGFAPFHIGKELKMRLLEWCRQKRTTLAMGVFTAYAGFVLHWCNASDAVLLYETDGRFSPRFQNTIGYFASRLYLRTKIIDEDRFVDLMSRLTREYCDALEHADNSLIEARLPAPEFTGNTCFNWLVQDPGSDHFDLASPQHGISCSHIFFEKRTIADLDMDHEPMIGLLEGEDGIRGYLQFPFSRFCAETMEEFTQHFLIFVRTLLAKPDSRLKDILPRI